MNQSIATGLVFALVLGVGGTASAAEAKRPLLAICEIASAS
jgi:hypothetical protein